MRKNRIGYSVMILFFAGILYGYGYPFFLWMVLLLVGLGILLRVMLGADAGKITLDLRIKNGGRKGTQVPAVFKIKKNTATLGKTKKVWGTRSVLVDLKIYNLMFDQTEYRSYELCLDGKSEDYEVMLDLMRCGEIRISCEGVWVTDMLRLYRIPAENFGDLSVTIYPQKINVKAELSGTTIGAPKSEGMMQNRKGNDPSEMFDVRDYVPGDDIRSIHWKLSSKVDNLILREASEPSYYNIVMLPDFGKYYGEESAEVPMEELQGIVAVGAALGEQLAGQGVEFCMALPTKDGLNLCEISSRREFRKMMPKWLACRIPEYAGGVLRSFVTEHMDQYFTRAVILSVGNAVQNLRGLEHRIGVTVVAVSADTENYYLDRNGNSELVEIPADYKEDEVYRIWC